MHIRHTTIHIRHLTTQYTSSPYNNTERQCATMCDDNVRRCATMCDDVRRCATMCDDRLSRSCQYGDVRRCAAMCGDPLVANFDLCPYGDVRRCGNPWSPTLTVVRAAMYGDVGTPGRQLRPLSGDVRRCGNPWSPTFTLFLAVNKVLLQ
jgi:hypothetical protein